MKNGVMVRVDIRQLAWQAARRLRNTLIPEVLFMPGPPGAFPTVVKIGALPIDEASLRRAALVRQPVIIEIDSATALQRHIKLPSAASAKADAAIGLLLRQTLPGQGRGLLWRSEPRGRQGGQTDYTVHIFKESQIDELIASLKRAGVAVHAVTIGKGTQPFWHAVPNAASVVRRWAIIAALAVALVSLICVVAIERQRAQVEDVLMARSARVTALEERLLVAKSKSEEGKLQEQSVLSDMAMFVAESRRLQLLADLTTALTDEIWVSEMSISGNRMVISGFTDGDVASVVSLLQQLSWTQNVQLNGPISYDSYSGQNRFELGLTIAEEVG
jgi:hypothetical protein